MFLLSIIESADRLNHDNDSAETPGLSDSFLSNRRGLST